MRFEAWRGPALTLLLLALGVGAPWLDGQPGTPARPHQESPGESGPNSSQAQAQRYLVLLSLDGFRWDYAERDGATHLLALGKGGAWAPEGMMPSFPAVGVSNRFTVVTGFYPGHHGLIAESFYDSKGMTHFSAAVKKESDEGSWYGGVPLWSLAESQGMRSAVMGWPGSASVIAGHRPSDTAEPCNDLQARKCVDMVLHWLHLAAPERPHFIAVEFSGLDEKASRFGPDSAEVKTAVLRADVFVGRLKAALDTADLPIDLVVVSDRGMAKTEAGWITLDQFTSLSSFKTDGALLYGQSEQECERAYRQLNHVSSLFVVYRRKYLPPDLHMSMNPRIGDPVVIATGPYAIRAHAPAAGQPDLPPPAGVDNLDQQAHPEMKAIFFASGPDITPGKTVGPFENVNLYPWMAHILGLKPPKSDGSLYILAGTLRDDGTDPQAAANQ
jgi:predicted AlkP superfamily pyrophosphatase or phosphodiesterase